MKIRKTYILAALAAFFALLTAALTIELMQFRAERDAKVFAQAETTTAEVKAGLEDLLGRVQDTAIEMGESFGQRDYTRTEIEDIVRQASLDFPELRGVTACYEPNAFSDTERLFCPFYNKASGEFVYVEESYDYTIPGDSTAWYTEVVRNGPNWAEPYYGESAKDWFIDFGVPFYWTKGERSNDVRGMIDFTLQTEDFKDFLSNMTVGKTGSEFLISETGTLLTHPITDYVGNENIETLMAEAQDPQLRAAYSDMLSGGTGHVAFYDTENADHALFFYDTISPANYRIGITYLQKDMVGPSTEISRRIIHIGLSLGAAVLILIAMIFGRDHLDRLEIEVLSGLTTATLIGLVVMISLLQHAKERSYDTNESPAIVDTAALEGFVNTVEQRAERLKTARPIPVPTGIWIQRLEFADSYNVNISGEIWAKYPESYAEESDENLGIRFPQVSPFAEAGYIEEIHRERVPAQEGLEGYLHVVWEYRQTLRLNLRYADFPFDKRHLDIQITPATVDDSILLVPALESYRFTNPSKNPGIAPDVKLAGNDITKAYFNFSTRNYTTDFGYPSQAQFQNVPRLHYNIYLKRKLINSFVTYLIPIFVALSLIYILILACEKTEARQGIIESMAAFFFVLIFSHIDLRKDIVTADLIFIEYFYFITYLMVILSTANLIAYTRSKTSLFDYNENQIYRALYFPFFFTLILIVMLYKFY